MGTIRIKRATLRKTGDRYEMWLPTQDKNHNTECVYGIDDDQLNIAGNRIDKHPKFPNVQQFEKWCNEYIVKYNVKGI